MKRLVTLAAIAAAMALQLAPAPVHAATASDCQTLVNTLSAATTTATFSSDKQGAKFQAGLLAHTDKATKDLGLGNYRSAAQDISDYLRDLSDAVASGRIAPDAAAVLQSDAQAALDCIDSLF